MLYTGFFFYTITRREMSLVSWRRRFANARKCRGAHPDESTRDDEDTTTETELLLGTTTKTIPIHKKTELLVWCNRAHGVFILP